MNKEFTQGSNGTGGADRADEVLESIFSHASARKRAPAADEQAVRQTLRSEWLVVSRRRRRRTYFSYGIAASLLLALAVGIGMRNRDVPAPLADPVASVEKHDGHVFVRQSGQDSSQSTRLSNMNLFAGQALSTARDARLALKLGSGETVRVDENSEIILASETEMELLKGRIYVDSNPSGPPAGPGGALAVETFAGVIRHLGTQYMAGVHGSTLAVSVREGKVSLRAGDVESIANPGQRISATEPGETTLSEIPIHGGMWAWTERVTPAYTLDGRSAHEFIHWVGRETGRAIRYAGDGAEQLARTTGLRGSIELEPLRALDLILQTSDLVPTVENGTIRIERRDR